jgi:hypothetical protein
MSSPVTKYLQPRYELVVGILGHFALLFGFPGRNAEALGRWFLAVPLERVAACKEISTVVAEIDLEWVRLCGFTVTLEAVPCVKSSFGADSALDLFHSPTGPVGLRGCEQYSVPCLEVLWDLEELVLWDLEELILLWGLEELILLWDLEELVLLCLFLLLLDYSLHTPRTCFVRSLGRAFATRPCWSDHSDATNMHI